jgi:hypothetical protein
MPDDKIRKPPLLATLISVLWGGIALLFLLAMLHLGPLRDHYQWMEQQSMAYRATYICIEVLYLIGSILLWYMKPLAGKIFLTSLILSLVLTTLFHSISNLSLSLPQQMERFALLTAITCYSWWVTAYKRTTRSAAPLSE